MYSETGWVKATSINSGLDHLGVQAPCINIYGRLQPGITNVTDRARYYSFYPWFFWACEQRYAKKNWNDLVEKFRRADCLLTLIAARHANQTDNIHGRHGRAMVGNEKLLPALKKLVEGNELRLSVFATREEKNPNRYFKNKLGGLGQYYLGVLQELGILEGNSVRGIKYTIERAEPLAKALGDGVDQELFFSVIEKDTVTIDDLDKLADFCPCHLSVESEEWQLLVDIFFNRQNVYGERGDQRKRSLLQVLTLADQIQKLDDSLVLDHFLFRGVVYTGFLPGGEVFAVPEYLQDIRDDWKIYQENELLSIAMQAIFWVALELIGRADYKLFSVEHFSKWFGEHKSVQKSLQGRLDQTFADAVSSVREKLPENSNWENENHEITLGRRILSLHKQCKKDHNYDLLLTAALDVLLSLAARGVEDNPYGQLDFVDQYFHYYPINLNSFYENVNGEWLNFNLRELLCWLAGKWAIESHFMVALHKMSRDKRDTFQIRPGEQGLEVVSEPEPVYTTPRFRQAIQVLRDLKLISRSNDNAPICLTPSGIAILEAANGN